MRKLQSYFHIREFTPEFVFVIDDFNINNTNPSMSLTNDVENVVEYLAKEGHLSVYNDINCRRIVYRDTEGCWDEIVHENGKFVKFASYEGYHP